MEKVYRSMKVAGASNLTIGIILMVVGLTTGIYLVVNGSRLLHRKNDIIF